MYSDATSFPKPSPLVIADTLLGCAKVLQHVKIDDNALEQIDAIMDQVNAKGISFQEAASILWIDLTAPIVAFTMHTVLRNWFDGGADQAVLASDYLYLGRFSLDETRPDDRIVAGLVRFLGELATIADDDESAASDVRSACEELEAIGDVLASVNSWEEAVRCFDVCCNLVALAGDPAFSQCAEKARRHVHRVEDAQLLAGVLLKTACARAALAEGDKQWELRAYDSLYDAILALPDQPLLYHQSKEFFHRCLQQDRFRSLVPLFVLSDPKLDRAALPETVRSMRLVPRISSQQLHAWVNELLTLRIALIEAENGRLTLEPKPLDPATAEADWTTWALAHPAYYRAIPDAGSFLREPARESMIMVLAHEMTHIFSMNGYVGMTILAMRAAIMSLVLGLWEGKREQLEVDEMLQALPALGRHDPLSLATAEQVLHLIRKVQLVRAVWAPWFEGIAVFSELADPMDDPEGYAPAMQVMQHLVDRVPDQTSDSTLEDIAASVKKFLEDNESLYSAAVGNCGVDRLRMYLVSYHHTYLAGYLAVRAVVAAWRRTLGEAISGAVAARILLHATRAGSQQALPDLSVPLGNFLESAMRSHTEWVKELMSFSAEDLRSAQQPYTSESGFNSARWVKGKFEQYTAEETSALSEELISYALRRAREAWNGLRGERRDLSSVLPGDESSALMLEMARALEQAEYHERFNKLVLERLVMQLAVLPIAEVDARFWLNRAEHAVFCLLRTSESSGDGGAPTYNGLVFELEEHEFETLVRKFEDSGESRMTVRRIVDMAPAGIVPNRGFGRHCLALQYDDWIHVQMRGLVAGVRSLVPSLSNSVRIRCVGDSITHFDREILADGRTFARHVREWVAASNTWEIHDLTFSISGWAQYVDHVGNEVLQEDDTQERHFVQRRILGEIAGLEADRIEAVLSRGLRALVRPEPHAMEKVIDLLWRSTRRPLQATPVPSCVTDDLFAQSPLGLDVRLPQPNRP